MNTDACSDYTATSFKLKIYKDMPASQSQGNPDNQETYKYCSNNNPCEKLLHPIQKKNTKKKLFKRGQKICGNVLLI